MLIWVYKDKSESRQAWGHTHSKDGFNFEGIVHSCTKWSTYLCVPPINNALLATLRVSWRSVAASSLSASNCSLAFSMYEGAIEGANEATSLNLLQCQECVLIVMHHMLLLQEELLWCWRIHCVRSSWTVGQTILVSCAPQAWGLYGIQSANIFLTTGACLEDIQSAIEGEQKREVSSNDGHAICPSSFVKITVLLCGRLFRNTCTDPAGSWWSRYAIH